MARAPKNEFESDYEPLLKFIHAMAAGDQRYRIPRPSPKGEPSDLDTVCLGLNRVAEQLQATTVQCDTYQVALNELLATQGMLVQRAKLAAIGQLSAGVGHEINQPLQVVRMHAEEIRHLLKQGVNHDIPELLDAVQEAVTRASSIVRQLRASACDVSPNAEDSLQLAPVIHQSLVLFREDLRIRDIVLVLKIDDSLPNIRGNHVEVQQVITNLLLYARDALEDSDKGSIRLTVFKEKAMVLMDIENSGPGMSAELQERIFDPFFTIKSAELGTGLGLSISERIMRRHGGALVLLDRPDSGSTFQLQFQAVG
jgi:C4-dicarboxylate-specific signal transduction histidine kinase